MATKILVIGDSGKTELVNKLVRGESRAPVVRENAPVVACSRQEKDSREKETRVRSRSTGGRRSSKEKVNAAEVAKTMADIMVRECEIKDELVTIYDCHSHFVHLELAKECHLVLVCQKLYGKLHGNSLLKCLGPEVLQRTIFVFTYGDQYKLFCTETGQEKEQMAEQKEATMGDIKQILTSNNIEKKIVDDIPSIITSAVEDSLPTTNGDSWVDELWELCKQRRIAAIPKANAKLLVVGHTRIGKSSFINKIVGQDVAKVQDGVLPCEHDLIVPIKCTVHGVPVMIYDSRGFSDPKFKNKKIIDTAISTIQTADVILICHKLYGVLDEAANKMLNQLAEISGNELMKHTIFVFTHGDEYKIRCKDKEDKKQHMEKQENHFKEELRKVLYSCNIEKDIVDDIPSIITCGEDKSLPTSDNWVDDFWFLCEKRCTPEAVEFVGWVRQNMTAIAAGAGGTIGGVVGGLAAGAVGGALVGTGIIPVPGVGTAVGAVVGAIGGAVVIGGIIVGGGIAAVGEGAKLVKKQSSDAEDKN